MQRRVEASDAQDANARSGELDGERNAVEPPTDFDDRGDVRVGERVRLALGDRAIDEERHARKPESFVRGERDFDIRDIERWDSVDPLALASKCLATGGDDA